VTGINLMIVLVVLVDETLCVIRLLRSTN